MSTCTTWRAGRSLSPSASNADRLMATILLTGATGYIASHTWLELQAAGYDVVGLDDFSNSSPEVLDRLEQLSGKTAGVRRPRVCDAEALNGVFERPRIDAVVHFAAF